MSLEFPVQVKRRFLKDGRRPGQIVGVAEAALRRWDALGKFKARRHPMNNHRVYVQKDVIRLRDRIWSGKAA
jgi:DNA-binding transcriptional MerR regulator